MALMSYGATIRKHRDRMLLSRRSLGDLIGKTDQAVYQYEVERIRPRREVARALDDALEADGEIVAALGYTADDEPDLTQLVVELRDAMQDQQAQLLRVAAGVTRQLKDLTELATELKVALESHRAETETRRRSTGTHS